MVEKNPYIHYIDLSDMLFDLPELQRNRLRKRVLALLLRNNSQLHMWYRKYRPKPEEQTEECFSMTCRQLWQFIKDAKIMNPHLTLASFNRCFVKGKKKIRAEFEGDVIPFSDIEDVDEQKRFFKLLTRDLRL